MIIIICNEAHCEEAILSEYQSFGHQKAHSSFFSRSTNRGYNIFISTRKLRLFHSMLFCGVKLTKAFVFAQFGSGILRIFQELISEIIQVLTENSCRIFLKSPYEIQERVQKTIGSLSYMPSTEDATWNIWSIFNYDGLLSVSEANNRIFTEDDVVLLCKVMQMSAFLFSENSLYISICMEMLKHATSEASDSISHLLTVTISCGFLNYILPFLITKAGADLLSAIKMLTSFIPISTVSAFSLKLLASVWCTLFSLMEGNIFPHIFGEFCTNVTDVIVLVAGFELENPHNEAAKLLFFEPKPIEQFKSIINSSEVLQQFSTEPEMAKRIAFLSELHYVKEEGGRQRYVRVYSLPLFIEKLNNRKNNL